MFWQLAVMSAFLGPDQTATETLLATDPDVAPWVQKYQRSRETVSQTDYEASLPLHSIFRIVKIITKIRLLLRSGRDNPDWNHHLCMNYDH